MASVYLWEGASLLLVVMGVAHLISTMTTTWLHPTKMSVIQEMKQTPLVIDRRIPLWEAWLGFNVAFSVCVALIGVINFYLGYRHFELVSGITVISVSTISGMVLTGMLAHHYKVNRLRTAFLVISLLYALAVLRISFRIEYF